MEHDTCDLTPLTTFIKEELTRADIATSLLLQNHIYGCFILCEDIAEHVLDPLDYITRVDIEFHKIGMEDGFIRNEQVILSDSFPRLKEYKELWRVCFDYINKTYNTSCIDTMEDTISLLIQSSTTADNSFYIKALETGELPSEIEKKALIILQTPHTLQTLQTPQPIVIESVSSPTNQVIKSPIAQPPLSPKMSKKQFTNTRRASKSQEQPSRFKKTLKRGHTESH
jgi:hypothetical protein